MARITKALVARNERIEQVIRNINEGLGKEHGDALGVYAGQYGADWATKLLDDWYAGRDASFCHPDTRAPLGHFLRQIRNHPTHGRAFYQAYRGTDK